ncbi:MAG: hypothetical protein B6D72_02715 [gamma proteobacterium symbiont of Ctena orbiculata]|nr:MAG: hypothetical protein DBP00_06890 [gamma proteobacterium symbiont of Ctena orbiculata]PVV13924.1 MAG: hypothetical protein B6D82_06950 [gamma proteobacterium symbiont of Ctena orbiculata]PVV15037.1 MAG: hypothetical protein B6D72_02715 [gamma proteobacterium symbiont of Ctena orbiculata]PVV19356.1 MAG: hypothetical protein B6D74_14890 [gamma proteobacterium symbiont of Ctena orbiculata]
MEQDLQTLADARVFFGHQSVGKNILEGIEGLLKDHQGIDLRIADYTTEVGESKGCLLHAAVGNNTEPLSKCVDFGRIIDEELAGKIDYALLKFCYIDINRDSDVSKVFNDYKRTMDDLIARHPEVTFIHATMPLRHSPGGPSIWLRELLGRPNKSKLDNIKRNQFNQMLRSNYNDSAIVDIAASESTYANGKRESFKMDGRTYYSLIGDYTDDGGHLNVQGRTRVASVFVQQIASIIRSHP